MPIQPLIKLDIVISIYNQEKIICKVLYGIFSNTTTPFNLILVFDGCTDRTKPRVLKYIEKRKPKLLQKLIIRDAPNVCETKANNIGFRLAEADYMITVQDDMLIQEWGWERRLTYPLRAYDGVAAVTARTAQDIARFDETHEEYQNRAGREFGTLPRHVFAVRDVINRGPVAFRMDYLRVLDYLDEHFAPGHLDDADLSLRAWRDHHWKCGAFWIAYDSPVAWGKARAPDSSMRAEHSNTKNRILIRAIHADYLRKNEKHSEDGTIDENDIDYVRPRPFLNTISWFNRFPHWYNHNDLSYSSRMIMSAAAQTCKRYLAAILKGILILFGHEEVRIVGVKNAIITNVGLTNGPTREAWLERTLKKIPAGSKILDAGAGELQYKRYCSHLEYTSQDLGTYDGQGTNEGIQMGKWDTRNVDIVSDITAIPVPDASFDAILCVEVFEHIPEPVKAVREFNRILKPGGKLILTIPFCSTTHQAPFFFANGYSKYWYSKVLPEYGFHIDELTFNGNFFEYLAQEIRRIPDVQFKYTNLNLTKRLLYRGAHIIMLRTLAKLSPASKKSEEFLCFGIHVLATKTPSPSPPSLW